MSIASDVTDIVELNAIPVFRAGSYPQGTFDPDYIQRLADNYDPQFHEAPNYLTHSDQTAANLAFGWIKRLYVKGQTLFADFVNVPRQFAELVLAGRIKKRSVEIYPDLAGKGPYLRAIAWPLVPEVKALADVHPTQVFNDESADNKIEIAFEEKESPNMSDQPQSVSHDEMQLAILQIRDELKAEMEKQLAELEVKNFCEQMLLAGRMTPAERDTEQPLLIGQRQRELAVNFSEGQSRLSDQRMDYYRRRAAVIDLPGHDGKTPPPARVDPNEQKLLRYFHENQKFFTRLGVSFDDLLAADRCEADGVNPLVQPSN